MTSRFGDEVEVVEHRHEGLRCVGADVRARRENDLVARRVAGPEPVDVLRAHVDMRQQRSQDRRDEYHGVIVGDITRHPRERSFVEGRRQRQQRCLAVVAREGLVRSPEAIDGDSCDGGAMRWSGDMTVICHHTKRESGTQAIEAADASYRWVYQLIRLGRAATSGSRSGASMRVEAFGFTFGERKGMDDYV
jgi:hypothetical protein